MKPTKRLRELMEKDGIIVAPGGFSPMCGILAEKVGFDCLYLSGYGVAAFKCGYPDVGLMTMNEALENAKFTVATTQIPVIVDIDNAYGKHGIYPLNYFLTRSATMNSEEETFSGKAARALLRKIIEEEDKAAPLSDKKLCEHMAMAACPVSRRTVAKYREEMQIPPAAQRRNEL